MRLSQRLKRNRKRKQMIENITNSVLFIAGAFVFGSALAISVFENIRMNGGF